MLTDLQASCGPEGATLSFSEPGWMQVYLGRMSLSHKFFCQDPVEEATEEDIFMVEITVPEEMMKACQAS